MIDRFEVVLAYVEFALFRDLYGEVPYLKVVFDRQSQVSLRKKCISSNRQNNIKIQMSLRLEICWTAEQIRKFARRP